MVSTADQFVDRFDFGFYSGSSTTKDVPGLWPVAINGHGYVVELPAADGSGKFSHDSIPYLKPYFLTEGDINERTLNPDGGWRRSAETWYKGAGQLHLDYTDSDRAMFRASKGVDVWDRWQLTLLPDTQAARVSAATNLALETAGAYLYAADGATLVHTLDGTTWVGSGISGTVNALTSDGHTVWAGLATGVYTTIRGATTAALYNDLPAALLAYRKGRLMAAAGPSIFNITWGHIPVPTGLTVTGLPTVLRSHAYLVGAVVIPATPNSHWYKCTTAGTTGSGVPTWGTTGGGTTTDGTVVWTEQGATAANTYRVSAVGAGGETLACAEVGAIGAATLTTTAPMTISWSAVVGAFTYKLYGRAAGAELFIASTASLTYTDTGAISPAGPLPAADLSGSAPPALFTHDNPDWVWTGFATGDSCIYAAGYSGDQSAIYRIGILADGTGLDQPIQAGELPRGEIAYSIVGYLGSVAVTTSKGVRQAGQASSGELQFAPVIPTGPSRCCAGDDRFVYFGWENYDADSTGLGRFDLSINNNSVPAYASDLMATTQGHVAAVVIWNGQPAFAVTGVGVYVPSANVVPAGTLTTGLITFDIPDPKVALYVQARHALPLTGDYTVAIAADEGVFESLSTRTENGAEVVITAGQLHGKAFELQLTLTAGTDPTAGPTIRRLTLITLPASQSGETYTVALHLWEEQLSNDVKLSMDVAAELAFLKSLRQNKTVFTYQEGATSYSATLEDYSWQPQELTKDGLAFNGTFIAQMKSLTPPSAS